MSDATLCTERLWLVPLDPEADAEDVHVAFADPEVMQFWDTPVCADRAQTFQQLKDSVAASGSHAWTVRDAENGPALGVVSILGGVDVPGLQWVLRRSAWGRGYAAEAVVAMVEHALGELELERVEAWIDVTNVRSLAVARRAGLTERARLPQHYPHRERPHESAVLGRAGKTEPTVVLNVVVELPVQDVRGTLALFADVVGSRAVIVEGDPPTFAAVGIGPWSGGQRIHLVAVKPDEVEPVALLLETATEFDAIHARALAAGVRVCQPPTSQPWGRREFTFELPEKHELTVSGPL